MNEFKLKAPYNPTGDQPQAIAELVKGFKEGNQCQTLLGVTGSGKTFTMANVIQQLQKPTLVIAHNKTLAAQLYGEFKEMFPDNAVEYFVSYYDYYQPEAYVPSSDTYIAKDSSVNEEIDKLRLSATAALIERRDVVVIASVSCIYGLGEPENFEQMMVSLRPGMEKDRDEVLRQLIDIQYDRTGAWYHQVFPSAVLSANMNFVTFIRNEIKMTSIRDKNRHFVTNLITNFWLIMVIVKVTNGGIYHE